MEPNCSISHWHAGLSLFSESCLLHMCVCVCVDVVYQVFKYEKKFASYVFPFFRMILYWRMDWWKWMEAKPLSQMWSKLLILLGSVASLLSGWVLATLSFLLVFYFYLIPNSSSFLCFPSNLWVWFPGNYDYFRWKLWFFVLCLFGFSISRKRGIWEGTIFTWLGGQE